MTDFYSSTEYNTKSIALQQESKPIGSITNGWRWRWRRWWSANSDGSKSFGAFTTSDQYHVTTNRYNPKKESVSFIKLTYIHLIISVMAPSPSNTNLNTPGSGQMNAAPSPLNPQEEQLYREKYRQLTKYIDPLKKMMARMGSDDEKLLKMNKLLEILCNPNQRIPLDTLIKCEAALEKMDLKSYSIPSNTSFPSGSKEYNVNNALMDAVSTNLQSPIGNHTLQRTFRPCIESLFGPDIK